MFTYKKRTDKNVPTKQKGDIKIMSYTENLKIAMDQYEELKAKYDEILLSDSYAAAISNAPYEFISAIHVCELLAAFNEDTPPSVMHYDSAADAASTYTKIIDFKEKKDDVLEKASAIVTAGDCAEQINSLVKGNPYLPLSLSVKTDETVFSYAKKAMEEAIHYDEFLSKKFRDKFTVSCIESLSAEELDKLVSGKIIRSVHMDNIPMEGSKGYEEKYRHLCIDVFDKKDICLGKYSQTLKGVSFSNEDGKSRQDLLAAIAEKMKAGEQVEITAQLETYTPELGKPEPSVPVRWNGDIIGFLQRESARQIAEWSDRNIQINASLNKITGGEKDKKKDNYGCVIDVDIRAMVNENTKAETAEKSK